MRTTVVGLTEGPGGPLSDVLGLFPIETSVTDGIGAILYALGFYSDPLATTGLPTPTILVDESKAFDATSFLSLNLQEAGWTARFKSDPPEAVPLPAALPLFAGGLGGLGLLGWRRRRKASAATC